MLKLENLNITFNRGTVDERQALDDFTLQVNKGDFITILGSNGAGKSTLFSAIAGGYNIDSGKIFIDEVEVTKLPEHKRARDIGRLFQDPLAGTAPNMTVAENLLLAYNRGSKRSLFSGINKKALELFRDSLKDLHLGLEDRLDTPMGLLSGGQRQAVTLIMSTIVTPKILLLDEHTAALDPATSEKVMDITKKIVEDRGITTLMITHNINSALTSGNRTILMSKGKILLDMDVRQRQEMTIPKLISKYEGNNDALGDTMLFA